MTGRTRIAKNSAAVKAVLKMLDGTARKYGLRDVRYAANKWVRGQGDKLRLTKQRAALERELAEVNQRLGRP